MKNLILVYGGSSVEHDISILTALQCEKALKALEYNVTKVYIDLHNKMYIGKELDIKENYVDKELLVKKLKKVNIFCNCLYVKTFGIFKKMFPIECIVNCCHGGVGENGKLSAYFDINCSKYTSADNLSSTVCMNKHFTKVLLKSEGICVVDGVLITKNDYLADKHKEIDKIKLLATNDIIVKPNSLGSSIGITICKTDDVEKALELVFSMDDNAIVEKCIQNLIEVNCAVVKFDNKIITSETEQPKKNGNFLSFEDKYIKDQSNKSVKGSDRIIPAPIDESLRKIITDTSLKAYKFLNLKGVVRIDYLIDCDSNTVYLNEINTIPGSLAYYLFEKVGIDYSTLLQIMIITALKETPPEINYFKSCVIKCD